MQARRSLTVAKDILRRGITVAAINSRPGLILSLSKDDRAIQTAACRR
jgi:hypothetical protein